MSEDYVPSDDEFEAFARGIKQKREAQKSKYSEGSGGGDFEQPKWVGLNSDDMHIVRIVSAPPFSIVPTNNPKAAVEVRISEIKDDNGKWFRLKLPPREDRLEHDHVLWRAISKVTETTWENKKKVSKWEAKYPELYARVTKGGWEPGSNQYKYSRGWAGQEVLILNVIDREDPEWHKANKHTKLLSKFINVSINDSGEQREWPTIGVPSFGFIDELGALATNDGSWQRYDIGIVKTGQKTSPYKLENASNIKDAIEKGVKMNNIPKEKLPFVVIGDLTEEEKAYEFYDLKKLYGPINMIGTLKHFGTSLKEIDADFGTDFYDEVKEKSAEEQKEWAAAREDSKEEAASTETKVSMVVEKPVVRTTHRETAVASQAANTKLSPEKIAALTGWDRLTVEQQNQIEDVIIKDGKVVEVKFSEASGPSVGCPDCGVASPSSWTHCIACNVDFE